MMIIGCFNDEDEGQTVAVWVSGPVQLFLLSSGPICASEGPALSQ